MHLKRHTLVCNSAPPNPALTSMNTRIQSAMLNTTPPIIAATILRPDGDSGVNTHIHHLQQYATSTGAPIQLITPYSWGGLLRTGLFAPRLLIDRLHPGTGIRWYRFWHEFILRRALHMTLARSPHATIYAQEPVAALAALRARHRRPPRIVLVLHSPQGSHADEWAIKGKLRPSDRTFRAIRRMERDVILSVDGLIYVSDYTRRALLEWLPDASRIPHQVIPNFIDIPRPAPRTARPTRDLVTIGNLTPVKNHSRLLHILAAAHRAGHPLSLDIYGDGPLRHELQRLATDLHLAEHVRLLGFHRDVRTSLPHYRAYIHTSLAESFGIAIIEAMAAALPIFAIAVGPIPELFTDGIQGRYLPLDDTTAAATMITDSLADTTWLGHASRAAYTRAADNFSLTAVGPRLLSFLNNIASIQSHAF